MTRDQHWRSGTKICAIPIGEGTNRGRKFRRRPWSPIRKEQHLGVEKLRGFCCGQSFAPSRVSLFQSIQGLKGNVAIVVRHLQRGVEEVDGCSHPRSSEKTAKVDHRGNHHVSRRVYLRRPDALYLIPRDDARMPVKHDSVLLKLHRKEFDKPLNLTPFSPHRDILLELITSAHRTDRPDGSSHSSKAGEQGLEVVDQVSPGVPAGSVLESRRLSEKNRKNDRGCDRNQTSSCESLPVLHSYLRQIRAAAYPTSNGA